jgi:hypothetical protein
MAGAVDGVLVKAGLGVVSGAGGRVATELEVVLVVVDLELGLRDIEVVGDSVDELEMLVLEVNTEVVTIAAKVAVEPRDETVMDGVWVKPVPVTPRMVCTVPAPTLKVPVPVSQSQVSLLASVSQQNKLFPQGNSSPLFRAIGSS